MSTFDKRQDGFENKFAHDEKLDFAIEARACKIFGLWIAEQLGLDGDDAMTYACTVVEAIWKKRVLMMFFERYALTLITKT